MRALAACSLLAATLLAGEDDRVRTLVEHLGASSPAVRGEAFQELALMGEEVLPALSAVESTDPEVNRLLRRLTRAVRKVKLHLLGPAESQPLGSTLTLTVAIHNDTDGPFTLPFQETRQKGKRPCFALHTDRGEVIRLLPNLVRGIGERVKIEEGDTATFTVTLEGSSSPLVRPGAIRIHCRYITRWAHRESGSEMEPLAMDSRSVVVRAHGRDNAALRAALRAGGRERASAITELAVRKDLAVLPLLREYTKDKDLALIAIGRLGDAALPRDFPKVAGALRYPTAEVRKAAVLALGNYRGSKARRALLRMIWDEELKGVAVDALCKHKHKRTVSAFIVLMRDHDGPWTKRIKDQLYEWTGLNVEPSEVGRFELWFNRKIKNGEPWDRPNK